MLLFALLLVLAALGLLIVALATSAMFWAWVSVVASVAACAMLIADWWRRKHASAAPVAEPAAAPAVIADEPDDLHPEAELDPETEPAEEDTDAADVLIVTDLDVEVRVLDERPRYHLADCHWVGERATLPLPIREARQLGFNPCAVCTPDAVIAERYRSSAE
ncbi:MAG TPA: hypothetical protein VJ914_23060 [Pseudonocardiaceae bacterium]|nr:hypothetical protein [Pseudonocardiaceae bacterium]